MPILCQTVSEGKMKDQEEGGRQTEKKTKKLITDRDKFRFNRKDNLLRHKKTHLQNG